MGAASAVVFPTAFLMTKQEYCIGGSETPGNFPPLVRAVALTGDGGLANLFLAIVCVFGGV